MPALERGLRLLGEFGRDSRTLGAPELARRLDLPRSTVFRMLTTLESLGFIERTGNDYRLGLAVLRLGFEYLSSLALTELGQPVISRLCDAIRQPCNLVVRGDGRHIVYVAKVTPPTPLSSSVRVGTRLPTHATVLGRILLEDLSLAVSRASLYPEEHLESFSDRTPCTTLELFNLVQADLERGFVLGEGFFEASISTVAAPVRDHSSRIVAALGVTIPSSRIEPGQLEDLVRSVQESAAELSSLLNYTPARAQPRQRGGTAALEGEIAMFTLDLSAAWRSSPVVPPASAWPRWNQALLVALLLSVAATKPAWLRRRAL